MVVGYHHFRKPPYTIYNSSIYSSLGIAPATSQPTPWRWYVVMMLLPWSLGLKSFRANQHSNGKNLKKSWSIASR